MRTTFVSVLTERAEFDENIFLLTPDMGFSVFEGFEERYPDRFLNTGIAEQNTVGIAAGLALSGFKPYIYSIAPFALMRCYEQIRIDASYMEANIKIVGAGGGVAYGSAGTTHHIIEDFAIAKVLPNMVVCAPADPLEARQIFEQSLCTESPMYIRLAKNNEPSVHFSDDVINIGKAFTLKEGGDLEILTTGTITHRVTEWLPELQKQGISAGVTIFPTIKPLDTEFLDVLIKTEKNILVVEEHNIIGGLGESICAYLAMKNVKNKIRLLGIPDVYSHYVGSQQFILDKFGLYAVPDINKLFSVEEI
jgi:transketolase